VITWDLPNIRGSPITAYKITIRQSDLVTYTESLATCDGTQTTIINSRSCSVPISTLRSAPYNLAWGSSIYAKVSASNIYGSSTESASENGAVILTVPDAPVNVVNVQALTAAA